MGWSCTTTRRAAPGDRRTFARIRGTGVSFRSLPNSLTADLREYARMTSKCMDGMVVYDDASRGAGRSADIRADPRYRRFVQEFTEQPYRSEGHSVLGLAVGGDAG
jgi:hypothetical protein